MTIENQNHLRNHYLPKVLKAKILASGKKKKNQV